MLARKSPNVWKIKYLLHLQECLVMVEKECDSMNLLIAHMMHIESTMEQPRERYLSEVCDTLEAGGREIKLVTQEVAALAARLNDVRTMAIEQLELSRNFWSGVLGFLIAVYAPLSFVSVRVLCTHVVESF
jgi:hypothetical protein